jgi:hypothetical protein
MSKIGIDETGCEFVTIGCSLGAESSKLYTYKCDPVVQTGDFVNVKLPRGAVVRVEVKEVHESPRLSPNWETKWAVIVQTKAEAAATPLEQSDLAKDLGL